MGGETGVIWTYQPPSVFSPQWMNGFGVAYDGTYEGSIVSVSSGCRAHRWIAAGGLTQLGAGTLDADWCAKAVAISDGSDVVAGHHQYMTASSLPSIWVQGVGLGNLYDYLTYGGLNPAELGNFSNYFVASDVSGNGRIIVGRNGGNFSGLPGRVVTARHN